MARTIVHQWGLRAMVVFVLGLIAFLVPAGPAFAEPMDLGKLPAGKVKAWCGEHNGSYADWGGGTETCLTDAGGGLMCTKDTCTGYPPKQPGKQAQMSFPKAGTGAVVNPGLQVAPPSGSAPTRRVAPGVKRAPGVQVQ